MKSECQVSLVKSIPQFNRLRSQEALIGEQEKEVMKNKQLQLEKDNRELGY